MKDMSALTQLLRECAESQALSQEARSLCAKALETVTSGELGSGPMSREELTIAVMAVGTLLAVVAELTVLRN